MKQISNSQHWELDSIFHNGSKSSEFISFIEHMELKAHDFQYHVVSFTTPQAENEIDKIL
ncbi:hypothetical protein [Aquibacillus kalidii]|uniref:hypothetical protein n=1 Tax=Aquibacillus kalidii TaxID=2762597 RepID=UPI0016461C64|nr:hypothetical protein [Aquibacillus kalidii]